MTSGSEWIKPHWTKNNNNNDDDKVCHINWADVYS